MVKQAVCRHKNKEGKSLWVFDYMSCCYVLKCSGCKKSANAYCLKDRHKVTLNEGDRVEILEDGTTIQKI